MEKKRDAAGPQHMKQGSGRRNEWVQSGSERSNMPKASSQVVDVGLGEVEVTSNWVENEYAPRSPAEGCTSKGCRMAQIL